MLNLQTPVARKPRDDGEKPFWISFSDLMSALMVLFLVVMSVALLAVTKKISEVDRGEAQRHADIEALMQEVRLVAAQFEGVKVVGTTIDFGPRATFEREGQNTLSPAQNALLRSFTPLLLDRLRSSEAGKHWFKRAVVEGYASRSGSYLFNLNLSLQRSERVLCTLLTAAPPDAPLGSDDRRMIAQRFFVGGASFNSLRDNPAESRRIEFKLEFKTRDERQLEAAGAAPAGVDEAALDAALNPQERCPIQDH
ncbi:OmpA family protein [Derxia lacustris]|uniref:flagellar motor protein MotB n=1 Tax=Derxia lacustris TaxID=764842 RepID=UPI000A16EE10|nr:flagellar motor protein MotB [Derxia lacustris]